MSGSLGVRLRAYAPNGGALGLLPQPTSMDASFVFNDVGSMTLVYSRKALNGSILERNLEAGLELAVEVSDDDNSWFEPIDARFLVIGRSRDALDATDTVTFTCPSYGWLLNKALMLDLSHLETDGDDKGKRRFKAANAGMILRTFLDENKARGGVPVTAGFDTGKDADGVPWDNVMTLSYEPGVSVLTALANLADNKIVDWCFDRRELRVYNYGSLRLSQDRTALRLQLPRDVSAAPEEESIEDLASNILVQGDNNRAFTKENPAAPRPWGKWETYLSQQGISDPATAELYMRGTLDMASKGRGQYTRTLDTVGMEYTPMIDYRPGHWITAPTVRHGEKVRVRQITLGIEGQRVKASVVLNDKVYDAAVRQAKRVQGIVGGAVAGGTGNGRPAPEKDHRVPKAPVGLVGSTDAYVTDQGGTVAFVSLQWAPVSQATDNTAIDIQRYRVEFRRNVAGAPWVYGADTVGSSTTAVVDGLLPNVAYAFRVRAIPTYSDRWGEWSGQLVLTTAFDVTPPAVPSKPILTSKLGVVDVKWDGLTVDGGRMEPDFDRCEVGLSDHDGDWTYRDAVAWDGHCIVTGLDYSKAYWFALRSVDQSGNKSDWSEGASIMVASAVSQEQVDRIQDDLEANQTAIDKANKDLAAARKLIDSAHSTASDALDAAKRAQTTADGRNRIFTQSSEPAHSGLVRGDLYRRLDSAGNIIGEYVWNGKQFTRHNLSADSVIVPNSASGSIILKDGTVTARKLVLADTTNLVPNPDWALGSWAWRLDGGKLTDNAGLPGNNGRGRVAETTTYTTGSGNAFISTATDRLYKAHAGDSFHLSVYARVTGGNRSKGSISLQIYCEKSDGKNAWVQATYRTFSSMNVGSWYLLEGNATAPAGTSRVAFWAHAGNNPNAGVHVQWWQPRMYRAANASLIVDGSITASKLVAGAVTADKLAANSVNASKIVAGAITASELASNAVTSVKIASRSITADKIAVGAITAEKLAATAITGKTITGGHINGATITGGLIRSKNGNSRVEVTQSGNTGVIRYINFAGHEYGHLNGVSNRASDAGTMTLYSDNILNIGAQYLRCNGVMADGAFCLATIRNPETHPNSAGTFTHGISYAETRNDFYVRTVNGVTGIAVRHKGWYLFSAVANAMIDKSYTGPVDVSIQRTGSPVGSGGLAPAGTTFENSAIRGEWQRITLPTGMAWLEASDVIYLKFYAQNGLSKVKMGSKCFLHIMKLPFGAIYHGGNWTRSLTSRQ